MFGNKEKVIHVIESFCNSFDEKDWDQMTSVLNEFLYVDYKSFRGTQPCMISADQFVDLRRKGLTGLITNHSCSNYEVTLEGDIIKCCCQFVIRRFESEGESYFHSYGSYEFELKEMMNCFRIISIRQMVDRNEGNRSIHGAFKQNE